MAEHTFGGPGASETDQAADAAFAAIDARLTELGIDSETAFALVMIMLPDGKLAHATVAANMPGEPSADAMLDHAVIQLSMLAAECGKRLVVLPAGN